MNHFETAPPLEISEWVNTPGPLTLSALRGRVVMLHAFQMLCPACVQHGLPLDDYTAISNAGNKQAGLVARLVAATMQEQSKAVASSKGQTDISGKTISDADLMKAVRQAVADALPGIAGAAVDPAVTAATGDTLQALLAAAATNVVAQTGLTADTVIATIGVAKLPADTSANTPTAGATLTALSYTNADNWFFRTTEASAADNTPDAAGNLRYYSVYKQSASSGRPRSAATSSRPEPSSITRPTPSPRPPSATTCERPM